MKYPHINNLVPQGEHFDETAMNNEGIWLTPGHVDSIEASLAQSGEAASVAASKITDLETTVTKLESTVQSSAEAFANAQAELGHKDAEIASLNEQIAELKKAPAGGFSNTTNDADHSNDKDPKEKYLNSSVTKAAMKYSKN